MATILAFDPGSKQTAYCLFENGRILDKGIELNDLVKSRVITAHNFDLFAIEFINYGMNVGREIFETVYWCGRWAEHVDAILKKPVKRIARQKIKTLLTGKPTCNDSIVRAALMQKYGGTKKGESLHGVTRDMWSALAVADYVSEGLKIGNLEEW